ncbi:MAG: ribosome silencing factor [Tatlockia sp.]|nr:ribosome silencing factor [Tatlockia sp.]
MSDQQLLLKQLQKSLDDIHANEVVVINVREHTSVTDYMIICSGRSSRHVKAIAETVAEQMKAAGLAPLSLNGLEGGEWALIDFGDFVLHVMQPDSRAFYNLEGLWQTTSDS